MKFPFATIDDAYKDWITRQLEGAEIPDKTWVLPIINDVTDSLYRVGIMWHRIALIEINNRRGELPVGFHQVIQAAYDFKLKENYVALMKSHLKTQIFSKCSRKVTITCEGCESEVCDCHNPIYNLQVDDWDYPELAYRDNPQTAYSYVQDYWNPINHQGGCSYYPDFKLMKLYEGNFFNLSKHIPNCKNLSVDSKIAYEIEPPFINVNFDKGFVLLAYMSKPTKNGFLLIPKTPKVFEAIRYAIDYEWDYVRSRRKLDNAIMSSLQFTSQMKEKSWHAAYGELSKLSKDELRQMIDAMHTVWYQDDADNLGRGYRDLNDNTYALQS